MNLLRILSKLMRMRIHTTDLAIVISFTEPSYRAQISHVFPVSLRIGSVIPKNIDKGPIRILAVFLSIDVSDN